MNAVIAERSEMLESEPNASAVFDLASEALNADLLFVNSGIERGVDSAIIDLVRSGKRKKEVILILVTSGGNADAAYRISKTLQNYYDRYHIFVPGWCKSAGTLIAIGAHTIYLAPGGELGPLDIQMGKRDELNDYVSGLDLDYGIRSLRSTSFAMFEHYMLRIITRSGYRVTFKTAAEIASGLAQSYIGKIAEQISPLNLGETVRMMTIATEYGERLNKKYSNLKDEESLSKLVSGYSSHSFVIDLDEAGEIFERVLPASDPLLHVMDALGWDYSLPVDDSGGPGMIGFLRSPADDARETGALETSDDANVTENGGEADSDQADDAHQPGEADGGAPPQAHSEEADSSGITSSDNQG